MHMGLTLCLELTIVAEHSIALQEVAAAPQKSHEVTLASPDQVQTQHPILTPSKFPLLYVESSMAPPPASGAKLPQ